MRIVFYGKMDGALFLIIVLLSLVLMVILRGVERLVRGMARAFRSKTGHIKDVVQAEPGPAATPHLPERTAAVRSMGGS